MSPPMIRPSHRTLLASVCALLFALSTAARAESELVFDLSGFVPSTVGGELIGVSTAGGHIVHARIDATFVSNQPAPWTLFANFALPTGIAGVDSQTEGWDGIDTFHQSFQTDAFNGLLAPGPGQPYYTWLLEYAGGAPFTLPGGGVGFGPVDGVFTELVLTLIVCDCPVGAWADLGHALAGTLGEPQLAGTGNLCRSAPTSVSLTNARPGGTAFMVLGASSVWLPFHAGLLIPDPSFLIVPLPIDGAGEVTIAFTFPIGLPPGLQLWFQNWIPDPAGVFGYAASNALLATVPADC